MPEDRKLTRAVEQALAKDERTAQLGSVHVKAVGPAIFIDGEVETTEQSGIVEEIVKSVSGVAMVRNRIQITLNLALGSAMASIGLTIPAIAVASIWLDGPLSLGLGPTQMVLLALTVVVSVLTVVPGRATRLQGGVHLVLLAGFLFLAIAP